MKNYGDYTKLAIDINIFSFKNKIISINSSIYIYYNRKYSLLNHGIRQSIKI